MSLYVDVNLVTNTSNEIRPSALQSEVIPHVTEYREAMLFSRGNHFIALKYVAVTVLVKPKNINS